VVHAKAMDLGHIDITPIITGQGKETHLEFTLSSGSGSQGPLAYHPSARQMQYKLNLGSADDTLPTSFPKKTF
jgi:hypothetical protein